MKKVLGIFLAVVIVILIGGKIYTSIIVKRAEAKYPPANFVMTEDVRLHYLDAGEGRPIVIIPGGGGILQDFSLSPLYEKVVDEYKVIIFDRPGLGYSEKLANEELTPVVQARLLHGVIDELGYEKPIILGQSWGGVIALAYAQTYSNEISGIVLLGSAPYPRERTTDPFDAIARTPVIGDILLQTLYVPIGRNWVAPAILEQNVEYFAPLDAVPESYYDAQIELGLRPSHLRATAEESHVIPASLAALIDGLDKVEVPVMILAGDQDTYAIEQAPLLEQDLPRAKVVVVEGANHFLWYSNPAVVVETIRQLWKWSSEL